MEVASDQDGQRWSLLSTLTKAFFLPVFVPVLAFRFLEYLKEKKYRDCLPGKVVVITGASSGLGEQLGTMTFALFCE